MHIDERVSDSDASYDNRARSRSPNRHGGAGRLNLRKRRRPDLSKPQKPKAGTKSKTYDKISAHGKGWRGRMSIKGKVECTPTRETETEAAKDLNSLAKHHNRPLPHPDVGTSNWDPAARKTKPWAKYYMGLKLYRKGHSTWESIHRAMKKDPQYADIAKKASSTLTGWRNKMKDHGYDPMKDPVERKVQ